MGMWHDLRGTSVRLSGSSGTVAIPSNAYLLQVHANPGSGAGTVQIFDDANPVTLPANSGWWGVQFNHTIAKPQAPAGSHNIVFTSTVAYYVEYVSPVGATS